MTLHDPMNETEKSAIPIWASTGKLAFLLRRAFEEGRREHPSLDLAYEAFACGVIERIHRRLVRARVQQSEDRVRETLQKSAWADLFLTIACREDIDDAWREFIRRYSAYLKDVGRQQGMTPADAEELAVNLLGDLASPASRGRLESLLDTYTGAGNLSKWLQVIYKRMAARQGGSPHPVSFEAGFEDEDHVPRGDHTIPSPDPFEEAAVNEVLGLLKDAMARGYEKLSNRETVAMQLLYSHGLAQNVIARILGVSEPRVSGLIKAARDKLKKEIQQRFSHENPARWGEGGRLWKKLGAFFQESMKDLDPGDTYSLKGIDS